MDRLLSLDRLDLLPSTDELLCSSNVFISKEESVFNANVVVDVVEVAGVLAGDSFFGEGAGQRQLVEDGLVSTEETVVLSFGGSVGVGDLVADVEDLAVVVNVGVISVSEAIARECGLDRSDDEFGTIWKFVCLTLHPWYGNSEGYHDKSEDCYGFHFLK